MSSRAAAVRQAGDNWHPLCVKWAVRCQQDSEQCVCYAQWVADFEKPKGDPALFDPPATTVSTLHLRCHAFVLGQRSGLPVDQCEAPDHAGVEPVPEVWLHLASTVSLAVDTGEAALHIWHDLERRLNRSI